MLNINNTLYSGGNYKGGSGWNKSATSIDQCFKLYYVERGKAQINSSDDCYKLVEGKCYFINGFKLKSQCCPDFFEVEWLHFINDSIFLRQILKKLPTVIELSSNFIHTHRNVFKLFSEYFINISTFKKTRSKQYFSIYMDMQAMLVSLIRTVIKELDTYVFQLGNDEIRLMPAINYINSSYRENIKLETLASLCCLSENYFHSLFKKAFGVTPYNYILQTRMNEAVRLLINTNISIKEIAIETGYSDVTYFTRMFSKNFNIGPGRYRVSAGERIP